jgi:hypothetical protein
MITLETETLSKCRQALNTARHELVTMDGLLAADGAAPAETFSIDTSKAVAEIDEALSLLS